MSRKRKIGLGIGVLLVAVFVATWMALFRTERLGSRFAFLAGVELTDVRTAFHDEFPVGRTYMIPATAAISEEYHLDSDFKSVETLVTREFKGRRYGSFKDHDEGRWTIVFMLSQRGLGDFDRLSLIEEGPKRVKVLVESIHPPTAADRFRHWLDRVLGRNRTK